MSYLNNTLDNNGFATWSGGHSYGLITGPYHNPGGYSRGTFNNGMPTQVPFTSWTNDGTNRQIIFEPKYDPNYPGNVRMEGRSKKWYE